VLTQHGRAVKKWLSEHPKVQAYVSRDEYEVLKELAEGMHMSISELVKRAISNLKELKEKVYEEGFNKGFESGFGEGEEATMFDIARGGLRC